MLESEGYTDLVNMEGGMHGAMDMSGSVVEPGWIACGHPQTSECEPERTWEHLGAS